MPCKMQFAPHVVYYEKHVFPTLIAFHHAPVSKNFALQLVSYFQSQHFSGVQSGTFLFSLSHFQHQQNLIYRTCKKEQRAFVLKKKGWKRKSSPSCVFLVFIHFPRVLWAEAIMIAHVWSAREVTAFSENKEIRHLSNPVLYLPLNVTGKLEKTLPPLQTGFTIACSQRLCSPCGCDR